MTFSQVIKKLADSQRYEVRLAYSHPTLYVFCIADDFKSIGADFRIDKIIEWGAVERDELSELINSSLIELVVLTKNELDQEYGFLNSGNESSWLTAFAPNLKFLAIDGVKSALEIPVGAGSLPSKPVRAIHFYGYKGGQGRSTVLLATSKTLADAGFRVLLIDADLEAPSLDAMLNTAATDVNSTLLGAANAGIVPRPLERAYVGESLVGQVDLMPARPAAASYDLDFAVFLLNSTLDLNVLTNAIARVRFMVDGASSGEKYDVVLIDHRTGLAPSVLPIVNAWPGSSVIFIRPDNMARHIQDSQLLDQLLCHNAESPGAFVSFSLDPNKNYDSARAHHMVFIESLLDKIATAMGNPEIDEEILNPHWVFWNHDAGFSDGQHPKPAEMGAANRQAVSQLRSVLGLSGNIQRATTTVRLSNSGSTDDGQFIQTPGLAKLFSAESPFTYIFGRKGTGKTRLLAELVNKGLAEPLLVASDSSAGGLVSNGIIFKELLDKCKGDYDIFWVLLLVAGLSTVSTTDNADFDVKVKNIIVNKLRKSSEYLAVVDLKRRRTFIIDGVETAVPASQLKQFVESLFRFLGVIQYDKTLSQFITVRLLLRTDLVMGASQNIEQQTEGKAAYLHWSKTAILNFALDRIASLSGFKNEFSNIVEKLNELKDQLSRGVLQDDRAESLLLEIFPAGLERNRLKTTTFFSTYFSDAGEDGGGESAFYPRLFAGFLKNLSEDLDGRKDIILDGKISSSVVLQAYDKASHSFMDEVRTELYSYLSLTDQGPEENRRAVDLLLNSFNGLQTPFGVDEIVGKLSALTRLSEEVVRVAILSMKKFGIFETRLGYPGELRIRQLYKAGLGMKYVRKKSGV